MAFTKKSWEELAFAIDFTKKLKVDANGAFVELLHTLIEIDVFQGVDTIITPFDLTGITSVRVTLIGSATASTTFLTTGFDSVSLVQEAGVLTPVAGLKVPLTEGITADNKQVSMEVTGGVPGIYTIRARARKKFVLTPGGTDFDPNDEGRTVQLSETLTIT